MAKLPTLEETTETARNTVKRAKAKLSILEDPWLCPECELPCEHSQAYDPIEGGFYKGQGGERPTYYCENCDTHYRRESKSRVTFSPWQR